MWLDLTWLDCTRCKQRLRSSCQESLCKKWIIIKNDVSFIYSRDIASSLWVSSGKSWSKGFRSWRELKEIKLFCVKLHTCNRYMKKWALGVLYWDSNGAKDKQPSEKYIFLAIAKMPCHLEKSLSEYMISSNWGTDWTPLPSKSGLSSIPLGPTSESLVPMVRVRIGGLRVRKEGKLMILSGSSLVSSLCNVNLATKSELLGYKPNNTIENLGEPPTHTNQRLTANLENL